MATMYSVLGGTLLNLGVTLSSQGNQAFANGSFIGAGDSYIIQLFSNIVWSCSCLHQLYSCDFIDIYLSICRHFRGSIFKVYATGEETWQVWEHDIIRSHQIQLLRASSICMIYIYILDLFFHSYFSHKHKIYEYELYRNMIGG